METVLLDQDKRTPENESSGHGPARLLSLDFFRGITMFFLIGTVYELMRNSNSAFLSAIGWQFEHRYWHGLTLYDFIEPFFMFIVGVAIPFSVMARRERGDSERKIFSHVLQRSALLFALGIFTYCVSEGRPVFRLWSVLTQLAFTYVLAFFLMRKSFRLQILVSLFLLVATELLYRFWAVEGFNQPFVPDHNFGSWFDLKTMGVLEHDHWVAFNFVPTAAFTIWGVMAGWVLRSGRPWQKKIRILVMTGLIGVLAGVALDPLTPMIKRIATSSVVLETGGWCFLALAFSYWLIDIKKIRRLPWFFAVVGMNPLFIYLFTQIGGTSFLEKIAAPFGYALFFWYGPPAIEFAAAMITWFFLWYMCFWLYKNKIFIKV